MVAWTKASSVHLYYAMHAMCFRVSFKNCLQCSFTIFYGADTSELLLKKYVCTTENILANTTEAHISMQTKNPQLY